MAKEKFQIGDTIKVNKTGKIGVINNSYSNGWRRVYEITIDNASHYHYSYEIQKYEKITKHNGQHQKEILEFDQIPFKNINSKSTEHLKYIASKITVDDNMVKNQYGDTDIVKRYIRLTLKEAQEMYNAGGKLREFALKVFTEDELKPKPKYPKTWDDYCDNFYPYEKHIHYVPQFVHGFSGEDGDAIIEFGKLIRLRNAWIGDWKPDWNNNCKVKWCIGFWKNEFGVFDFYVTSRSLSFPTKEMAEDFMNCFKDLLNKAKTLI